MATYNLEQQEQIDQFKHFWNQYGNLITWLLVLILGGYAAWMGYNYLQQKRSTEAANVYEALESAAQTGDAGKVKQAFTDLKDKYAGTTFAQQGALLTARAAVERQDNDQAKAALQWLVENGKNPDLVAVARLRLAGMQMDAKQFDEALKTLAPELPQEFAPLAADRRGDILLAQGKKDEAVKAYQTAWKGLGPEVEYRRFIDGKLTSLGQPPEPAGQSAISPVGAQMLPPGTLPAN